MSILARRIWRWARLGKPSNIWSFLRNSTLNWPRSYATRLPATTSGPKLPLPPGEGRGEGLWSHKNPGAPHPNPLPAGRALRPCADAVAPRAKTPSADTVAEEGTRKHASEHPALGVRL